MYQIDVASAAATRPASTTPGTAGYFTDGNAGTGVPATVVPAEFLNSVMLELLNVVSAAGVTPSKSTFNQLLTALRSPGVFTTPAQFDSSTKAATTAFVQSALGNMRGMASYGVTTQLTVADMGKFVYSSAAGSVTFTLPDATTLPAGTSVYLYNSASASGTLTVASPNGVFSGPGNNGGASSTLSLPVGVGNQFISSGTSWFAIGAGGLASIASSGYQKLPSGLIIQWGKYVSSASAGVAVTFPVAFPNNFLQITIGPFDTNVSSAWGGYYNPTTTGFQGSAWTGQSTRVGSWTMSYIAIGY